MPTCGVILCKRSSVALQIETRLQEAGFDVAMIPVPREISDDCGVSVRFVWDDLEQIDALLKSLGIETDGIQPLG